MSTANLPSFEIDTAEVPTVSGKEILETGQKIIGNKAPDLDSILNKALKAAVKIAPNMFAEAFTTCLKEGPFPTQWKKQKLILVSKPNKSLGEASSYGGVIAGMVAIEILAKEIQRLYDRADFTGEYPARRRQFAVQRTELKVEKSPKCPKHECRLAKQN